MNGAAALVLMLSAMAVLLVGVESQQRVCYSGPPPEPDPDNPDDWMKQVMQEIRKRCPGRRQPTLAECSSLQPLGMEDGTIQDDHITASSIWSTTYPARKARLNIDNGWAASSDDANPWIEVDLFQSTVVSGVTTQGAGRGSHVTAYKVAYKKQPSSDREHVTDGNGNIKVFIGNTDRNTPVTNLFDESVVATVVRIEPTERYANAALRLELLGCRRG
ncbi:EGF-like repeat and discoidin I-like domain-containing protein 3 [Patiria miniata]|uniref:F5/8 type C domain-containing protein n=1 Tax=Patiria miniata TaxID=46514 RepID=A0A913ZJ31_PATMI|nr:EGF-like repeat and discoidin I-like domain-containing protein 3 [Patiria miniata]